MLNQIRFIMKTMNNLTIKTHQKTLIATSKYTLFYSIALVFAFALFSCNKDEPSPVTKDITDGLVAKFTFDNNNLKDEVGGLTGDNAIASYSTDTFNGSGNAIEFTATDNEIVTINNSIIKQDVDFTVSFWFKLNSTSGNVLVSSRTDNTGGEIGGIDFGINYLGELQVVGRRHNPFKDLVIIKYAGISTNSWYHCVGKTEGSKLSVWVNGVEVASGQVVGYADGVRISTSTMWSLGAMYTRASGQTPIFRELDGLLDDIRFYDRALLEDEIKTLSNQRN